MLLCRTAPRAGAGMASQSLKPGSAIPFFPDQFILACTCCRTPMKAPKVRPAVQMLVARPRKASLIESDGLFLLHLGANRNANSLRATNACL